MGKVALRHVLKNFLNHFETLESRRRFNQDDDLYQKEFQSLKELTETLKRDEDYMCGQGLEDVNRKKNRYKDILPYDHSRVILSDYPGVPGSDYINANYVRGSTGSSCAYIASQGPLPNTVVDYWRMIWECEVTVIVMACNETESGKYKCECYWPPTPDQTLQYGNISVALVKWKQVCPDFLVRTLKIKSNDEERVVCQFHYTTWPDHGVPHSVGPILELVRLIRDVQASEARPILVHCSAGCGRTGTICSIDYVWALLRTGKLTEDFSLYTIIRDMRRQRIAMVQTQEQYVLCYRAVAALFEQQLKMIDAHTYENLNDEGEPLFSSEDEDASLCRPPAMSAEPLFAAAGRTRVSMSCAVFETPATCNEIKMESDGNRDFEPIVGCRSGSDAASATVQHTRSTSTSSMFGQLMMTSSSSTATNDSPHSHLGVASNLIASGERNNNRNADSDDESAANHDEDENDDEDGDDDDDNDEDVPDLSLDSGQSEPDQMMEHKSVEQNVRRASLAAPPPPSSPPSLHRQPALANHCSSNSSDGNSNGHSRSSSCCSDSEALRISSAAQSNCRTSSIPKYGTISGAFARSIANDCNSADIISKMNHDRRPRLPFGSLRQTPFHKSSPNFEVNTFDVCDNGRCSPITSVPAIADEPIRPQEKLVGKATVIRRPSIAKLKAMFENMSSFDSGFREPNLNVNGRGGRRKSGNLQRSLSTRERISNANPWSSGNDSAATTDTLATDDDSARAASRSTDTLERRASLFGLHTLDVSSFEQLAGDRRTSDRDSTCGMWDGTCKVGTADGPSNRTMMKSINSDPAATTNSNPSESASFTGDSDVFERKELGSLDATDRSNSMLLNSYEMPPPKPPRTYQYMDMEPENAVSVPSYRLRSESQSSNSVFAEHVVSVPAPVMSQGSTKHNSLRSDHQQHHRNSLIQDGSGKRSATTMTNMFNTLAGTRVDRKMTSRVHPNNAGQTTYMQCSQQQQQPQQLYDQHMVRINSVQQPYGYQTIATNPSSISNVKIHSKSSHNLIDVIRTEHEPQLYEPLRIARSISTTLHSSGNKPLQVLPTNTGQLANPGRSVDVGHNSMYSQNMHSKALSNGVATNQMNQSPAKNGPSQRNQLSVQPINSIYERLPVNGLSNQKSIDLPVDSPANQSAYGILNRHSRITSNENNYEINHNYSSVIGHNRPKSTYTHANSNPAHIHSQMLNSQLNSQLKQHFANKMMNQTQQPPPPMSYNQHHAAATGNKEPAPNRRLQAPMSIVRPTMQSTLQPKPTYLSVRDHQTTSISTMPIQNGLNSVRQMPVPPVASRQPNVTDRSSKLINQKIGGNATTQSAAPTSGKTKEADQIVHRNTSKNRNDEKRHNEKEPSSTNQVPGLLQDSRNESMMRNESGRKSGNTFNAISAIFGFSKRKSKKSVSAAHLNGSASNSGLTSTSSTNSTSAGNIGLIRPPHSHRFSPPTQWTQV